MIYSTTPVAHTQFGGIKDLGKKLKFSLKKKKEKTGGDSFTASNPPKAAKALPDKPKADAGQPTAPTSNIIVIKGSQVPKDFVTNIEGHYDKQLKTLSPEWENNLRGNGINVACINGNETKAEAETLLDTILLRNFNNAEERGLLTASDKDGYLEHFKRKQGKFFPNLVTETSRKNIPLFFYPDLKIILANNRATKAFLPKEKAELGLPAYLTHEICHVKDTFVGKSHYGPKASAFSQIDPDYRELVWEEGMKGRDTLLAMPKPSFPVPAISYLFPTEPEEAYKQHRPQWNPGMEAVTGIILNEGDAHLFPPKIIQSVFPKTRAHLNQYF